VRRSVSGLAMACALAAAALGPLAAGCGSAPAHPAGATHSAAPADGPSVPSPSSSSSAKGHADPGLEALLPRRLNGYGLARASTTGAAIFAEFGSTAWARQMTKYLASVGKKPADLHYAQAWDPSQQLGLDAGVFQADGVSAAALRDAIINASRPDSPSLTVSRATLAGKRVTVLLDGASGNTLYLYDYREDVFYTGGSGQSLAAQFLSHVP
jgi:hypothetical protein